MLDDILKKIIDMLSKKCPKYKKTILGKTRLFEDLGIGDAHQKLLAQDLTKIAGEYKRGSIVSITEVEKAETVNDFADTVWKKVKG